MKFSIITSKKDNAGMNIRESLLKLGFIITNESLQNELIYILEFGGKKIKLFTITEDTVHFSSQIETDFIIFATRHQSESGEKTLSVHIPGNYGSADFGGKENELCVAPSSLMKQAFINLNKLGQDSGYKITLEATHHGPALEKPVMFIEIGSNEEQWSDTNAGDIIAKTILKTIQEYEHKDYETAIGFGGTHYCPNFNKIELNSNTALSHICPKYNIDNIDRDMIQQMINKTYESVDYVLLDWKGLSGENKQKLKYIFEKLKLRWKKTKDVK